MKSPSPSWVKKTVPFTPSLPLSTATAFTIVFCVLKQTRNFNNSNNSKVMQDQEKSIIITATKEGKKKCK